eukprot:1072873-Pelagomonas_calceolata.AAC.2
MPCNCMNHTAYARTLKHTACTNYGVGTWNGPTLQSLAATQSGYCWAVGLLQSPCRHTDSVYTLVTVLTLPYASGAEQAQQQPLVCIALSTNQSAGFVTQEPSRLCYLVSDATEHMPGAQGYEHLISNTL